MAMEERDRIDIIATLHDRFNRPADEIIAKMEALEEQADDTGDSIDEMEKSLDKEGETTKRSSKLIDGNTKARRKSEESILDQADAIQRSTRRLNDHNNALRNGLSPQNRHAEAVRQSAKNAAEMAATTLDAAEAQDDNADAVQRSTRSLRDYTKRLSRARTELIRCGMNLDKTTESIDKNTEKVKESTEAVEENTDTKRKDRDEWTKWDNKIKKITQGFNKRFRPIGNFYRNYFKVIGAFRSLLFSDIGAAIPQVITAIVALGAAANATLGPLGRLGGTLGQVVPLMLAIQQMKAVFKIAFGGLEDALKVLNDANATAQELAEAQKRAGENTWAMAKYVNKLKDRVEVLKKSVRETFWDGMVEPVDQLANTYLPIFNRNLTKTADIMNGELKRGMESLQDPEKQESIDSVMSRGAEASGLLVDVLFSLLDVVIELADAAGPSFISTLEGINEKLDTFATWIRDNKAEVTNFFDRAGETAGNFLRGLGFLALGLYGITKAAEPLEDFLYGGLVDRLEGWSEKMNDPKQQEIMRENYEKMIPNLAAIGNLIGAIIDGAKEIATSEWFAPLVNDLADNGIPMMVEYFKTLDETVGPPLLRISDALSGIDPDVLTSVLAPLGDALGGLATALEIVVPLFTALPEPMQKVVMYGIGLATMGLPGLLMLIFGPLNLINKALVRLTGKGILGWTIEGFKKLGSAVKWVGTQFGKLKDSKFGKALSAIFQPIKEFFSKHGGKLLKGGGGIFARLFGKGAGKAILGVLGPVGAVISVLWLLWDVLSWLWNNSKGFRDFIGGVWDWISNAWSVSIDWIVNTAIPWVIGAFTSIWETIKKVGAWIAGFYDKWIKPVVDGIIWLGKLIFVVVGTLIISPFVIAWNILSPIFKGIWDWMMTWLPDALAWLGDAWRGFTDWLGETWPKVWQKVKDFALGIWDALKIGWEWLGNAFTWGKLIVLGVVGAIVFAWGWLRDKTTQVWNWIKDNVIQPVIDWFRFTAWPVLKGVIDWIVGAFNWMRDRVRDAWNWVKLNVIQPVVIWFMINVWPTIRNVIQWIGDKFNWLKDRATTSWNWMRFNVIDPVVNWFMTYVWPQLRNAINWLKDKFDWLKDKAGQAWSALKDKISDVYNNNIKPIFDGFKNMLSSLEDSFRIARDAIGEIWDELKNKVRGPSQYIIDVVYNDGIRKVWNNLADAVDLGITLKPVTLGGGKTTGGGAGGGSKMRAAYDTGGYTGPGPKYMPAGIVHADEFVIRKESQRSLRRAVPGFLDMLNNYGARALPMMGLGGYDGGGKVEELAKGVVVTPAMRAGATAGAIASGADGDSIVDFSDPFGGMIDRFTKGLRERFDAGKFIDIGIGIVKKLVNGAKNFVGDKLAGGWENVKGIASDVKNAVSGFAYKGVGFARAAQAAASLGLRVTSGYRPGARTAGSGVVSLHAQNRARDYAGSPSAMREFFNRMDRPPYPTELLYTPMGARNIHRSGRRYPNSGATARNHYDHVHVGFHRGGLVPVDHMRFMGGPVETWGNTLVGEFGPEMFFPSNGDPASLVGLDGPEVLSFNQEGAIAPHKAVAALDAYNDHMTSGNHTENNETSHYDVKVTVGSGATELDVEGAVERAIAKAERKKRERR